MEQYTSIFKMRNFCKIGLIIASFYLKVLSAAFTDLHFLADTALADAEEQMKKITSFDLNDDVNVDYCHPDGGLSGFQPTHNIDCDGIHQPALKLRKSVLSSPGQYFPGCQISQSSELFKICAKAQFTPEGIKPRKFKSHWKFVEFPDLPRTGNLPENNGRINTPHNPRTEAQAITLNNIQLGIVGSQNYGFRLPEEDIKMNAKIQGNTEDSDTFLSGKLDPELNLKLWASVSVIFQNVENLMGEELREHPDKFFIPLPQPPSTLYQYKSANKGINTQVGIHTKMKVQTPSQFSKHSKMKAKELVRSLWILNNKVLMILGFKQSWNSYIEEQKEFLQWINKFMRLGKKRKRRNGSHRSMIYEEISRAIHSPPELKTYQFYPQGGRSKPILFSKGELLMNEAAVHLNFYYHKNVRNVERKELFINDISFALQISSFKNHLKFINDPNVHKGDFPVAKFRLSTPWTFLLEGTELFSNSISTSLKNIANHVYPIFPQKQIAQFQFQTTKAFEISGPTDKNWAWITWMKLYKRSEVSKSFQPTSPSILNEIYSKLRVVAEKNLPETQKQKFMSKSVQDVSEGLDKVFDLLWNSNKEILESFGCEIMGEDYINEQKLVQIYFLSCFNEGEKDNEIQKSSQEVANPHEIRNKIILGLSIDMILSDRTKNIYQFKGKNFLEKSKGFSVQQEDLILAKLVVNILGYYYKNQNYEKWVQVFNKESIFFSYLMNKSTILFHFQKIQLFKSKKYKILSSSKVIPWNRKIDSIAQGLHAHINSHREPTVDKWLIDIRDENHEAHDGKIS